jgi:hypothetical protein
MKYHHVRSPSLELPIAQRLFHENVMHSLDDVEIASSICYFLEFNLNDEFYKNGKSIR